jgi:hypothetical protein
VSVQRGLCRSLLDEVGKDAGEGRVPQFGFAKRCPITAAAGREIGFTQPHFAFQPPLISEAFPSMETKHCFIRDNEEHVVHETCIGAGGYGEVHRVNSLPFELCSTDANVRAKMRNTENDTVFARKVIRPFVGIPDVDIQNEVRAINRLCRTGHPNIVQVLEYAP